MDTSLTLRQHFETDGYAIIEGLLDDTVISPIVDDYDALLDHLAGQFYAARQIPSAYAAFTI